VTNDTETAKKAINDFVAKYNNLAILLQPAPLSDEQRKYLTPLSEDDKAQMTFSEADDYEANYKLFNIHGANSL